MNPQAWNRYTYCLNNPLKYIDPSGNIVKIGNSVSYSYSDGERALTYHSASYSVNDEKLINAWNLLADACPDIAKRLESSDTEYSIRWSPGILVSTTLGNSGDQTMLISRSLMSDQRSVRRVAV